jgi:AcrR family transcriptional regulator
MSADKPLTAPGSAKKPAPNDTRKEQSGAGTRAHILAAAAELAKEKGAAHISIEAIAQRAGISKGGFLYHFPRKDALIQALVEQHMAEIDAVLADVESASGPRRTNAIARTIIDLSSEKLCQRSEKLEGLFLALAENPHLLAPVRDYEKRIAERIRRTASDRELSLIALLVIEGMRSLELFESNPRTAEECSAVLERLLSLLDDGQDRGSQGAAT